MLQGMFTNKDMFTTFESSEVENVFMGNSASVAIKGQGKVILKMISIKRLTLNDVFYVPKSAITWCLAHY